MSRPVEQELTCPKCGKKSSFTIWQSVNTELDPELKKKVLNKELFKFVCPHCGADANVDYGILYHQMEDRIMIYYVQDEEGFETASSFFSGEVASGEEDPVFKDMLKGMEEYLYRIVTSQNDLIEKIRIFDAGKDDRIIEIMKAILSVKITNEEKDIDDFELYYGGLNGDDEFVVVGKEEIYGTIHAPEGMYEDLEKAFLPMLPDIKDKGCFLIDMQWAIGVLSAMEEGNGKVS